METYNRIYGTKKIADTMIVMRETLEKQKIERLESLNRLLDSIYEEPTGEEPERELPSGREKRERVILLAMLGL